MERLPHGVPVLTAADYPSVVEDAEVNYYAARDRLREAAPIYRVELGEMEPYYTVMRDDLVKRVLMDPETFPHAASDASNPHGMMPLLPTSKEGAELARYRAVVQGWFNPLKVRAFRERMREIAIELIEPIVPRGQCEFQHDLGEFFPGLIMLELFNMDRAFLPGLVELERVMWTAPEDDPDYAIRNHATELLMVWIDEQIEKCQKSRDDSVVNYLLDSEVNGEKLTPFDVKMFMIIFVQGGLHTTKALMGKMMVILAQDPELRRRLTADPELWPRFIEETLRTHAMGESFRRVAKDTELEGCPLKKGDLLAVNWTAANRDPRAFEHAAEIYLDAPQKARHTAFGYGGHICMGMHIARADLTILLEEWHKRVPDYWLAEGTVIREQSWAGAGVLEVPLRWNV